MAGINTTTTVKITPVGSKIGFAFEGKMHVFPFAISVTDTEMHIYPLQAGITITRPLSGFANAAGAAYGDMGQLMSAVANFVG